MSIRRIFTRTRRDVRASKPPVLAPGRRSAARLGGEEITRLMVNTRPASECGKTMRRQERGSCCLRGRDGSVWRRAGLRARPERAVREGAQDRFIACPADEGRDAQGPPATDLRCAGIEDEGRRESLPSRRAVHAARRGRHDAKIFGRDGTSGEGAWASPPRRRVNWTGGAGREKRR